jgi:hypothetical protein
MGEQNLPADLLKFINFDFFAIFLKLILAYFLATMIKNCAVSLLNYMYIRFDNRFSLNTLIRHGDFTGKISNIGLWYVSIESTNGDIKKVKNDKWWDSPLIVLNQLGTREER